MESNTYFNEVFQGMERLSPGGVGSTRKMMKCIPEKEELSILEIGCGQGQTTLALAQRFPKARIIAIDTNQDYIRHLNQKATALGIAQQVQGVVMSVHEMQFPTGQFDVIWAEGSIYLTGFDTALEEWKKYLRPEGLLIANDLCWKEKLVSSQYIKRIEEVFGPLQYYKEKGRSVTGKGFALVEEFVQPNCDWLQGYYYPMSARLTELEEKYPDSPEMQEVSSVLRKEIQLFDDYSPFYAYVYFVLQYKGEKN